MLGRHSYKCAFAIAVYFAGAQNAAATSPDPGKPEFDPKIQPAMEAILKSALEKYNESAGFIIVANPQTGKVLAAANADHGFDKSLTGDWALRYQIEPGPAIRTLLIAIALEAKVTKIDEMHNCENGKYKYGNFTFADFESFDHLSTGETLVNSSDICTLKIAQKMDAPLLENGLKEFGIGKEGSTKYFPGAGEGFVPSPKDLGQEYFITNIALGYSMKRGPHLTVTPLELVMAYAAIASGGKLMRAITGNQKPLIIRKVVSGRVAREIQGALMKVTESGTAHQLKDADVKLAGKTITTTFRNKTKRQFRLAGFIGYAPASRPKLVTFVGLMAPKKATLITGATTAAPLFKEAIETALANYKP